MVNHKEISAKLTELGEVFNNITTARRMLYSKPLDRQLFDELNGEDCGLESLLGHDVFVDFDNAAEVAKLKTEIHAALETTEISLGEEYRAALECFCEDLTTIMTQYDAYSTQNADVREKLIEKLKTFTTKDSQKSLADLKIDAQCFGYTHAHEIIVLMAEITKFFVDNGAFNIRRLEDISRKNGIDMLEEDKEFLDTLTKVFKSDYRDPGWKKMDVVWGDRLTNATLGALGYDSKKIREMCKLLTKTENEFYKTVRDIRETLCQETDTTDACCTKNTEFYSAVDSVIWYAHECANLGRALSEQLAIFKTNIDTISTTPSPEETANKNPEDENNEPPDEHTDDDDHSEDNNQPDNTEEV